jgi:acyl carrier protein
MPEAPDRLAQCFMAVFPGLKAGDVSQASVENIGSWDSLATMRLVSTIEQEFEIEIEADALDQMSSFQQIAERLREQGIRV